MLGTAFFNDMIGQKGAKGKIFDNQLAENVEEGQDDSQVFTAEDMTEGRTLSSFSTRLTKDYESALEETVQSDEDFAAAYTFCSEARKGCRIGSRVEGSGA